MIPVLAYVVIGLAAVSVVWGIVTAIKDIPPGRAQLLFAAGVWLITLAQSVIAGIMIATGFRPASLATTIGYLIGIVVIIPLAWFWANVERTRFSGIVLAVAAMATLAMTLRLLSLWVPTG
jgi:hypothetical protein